MERLEVLKWLQKSYILVGIFFQRFPSYKTDDLLFLWARIYMLVFLHIAASSHIFYLEFLCRTNPPSLKREGGDLFPIACTRQRGGDVRMPLAGFIGLFVASFLYKNHEAKVKRLISPEHFLQILCQIFPSAWSCPSSRLFCDAVSRGHELRAKRKLWWSGRVVDKFCSASLW